MAPSVRLFSSNPAPLIKGLCSIGKYVRKFSVGKSLLSSLDPFQRTTVRSLEPDGRTPGYDDPTKVDRPEGGVGRTVSGSRCPL